MNHSRTRTDNLQDKEKRKSSLKDESLQDESLQDVVARQERRSLVDNRNIRKNKGKKPAEATTKSAFYGLAGSFN